MCSLKTSGPPWQPQQLASVQRSRALVQKTGETYLFSDESTVFYFLFDIGNKWLTIQRREIDVKNVGSTMRRSRCLNVTTRCCYSCTLCPPQQEMMLAAHQQQGKGRHFVHAAFFLLYSLITNVYINQNVFVRQTHVDLQQQNFNI